MSEQKISIEDVKTALKVIKAMHLADLVIYDFDNNHVELETNAYPDQDFTKEWMTDQLAANRIFALLPADKVKPS
jgi:hypothetical protein